MNSREKGRHPGVTAIYLPSQHASVHDLPLDPETRTQVLADIVAAALALQQADGNFEDPAADDDIGDMSLGVISLLCLAWHRGDRRDEQLIEATRRGVDHFLRDRVFRTDNPGELFLRRRDSGLPHARYLLGDGELPFGDWPSTVWAMLHAVNVIELGEGLLTDEQYAQVTELAVGYWTWLTEVSMFNPQQTANQAIGSIAAALILARLLRARGRGAEADKIAADAIRLYLNEIRAQRIIDRGFALPTEHGVGHDQNYVPISLSFLAKAYEESGEAFFAEDGDEIARHLETRLSVRGFDFGGPRYCEQHCGFEGMLGLKYFGRRIGADLGRYLGDRHCAYHWLAKNSAPSGHFACHWPAKIGAPSGHFAYDWPAQIGAPSGHFAFMTVWLLQDDSDWFRRGPEPHQTPYSVRSGRTSVTLTSQLTPYVVDASDSAVIEAIADYQHGIGPILQYPDGSRTLLTRPLGPMRTRDAVAANLAPKLITKPVVTRDKAMVAVQQLIVCDGERAHLIAVLARSALPADATVEILAGLPYLESIDSHQRKILSISPASSATSGSGAATSISYAFPDPAPFGLGTPDAVLETSGSITAGQLTIRAAGTLRVINPPDALTHFNSPRTIGLTLEQLAFTLADDPHGYGNPDSGWHRVAGTNLVLASPLPDAPPGLAVFAVSYGPATDQPAYRVTAEAAPNGVLIHTPDFSALIGHPAGDENGDPVLTLTPR